MKIDPIMRLAAVAGGAALLAVLATGGGGGERTQLSARYLQGGGSCARAGELEVRRHRRVGWRQAHAQHGLDLRCTQCERDVAFGRLDIGEMLAEPVARTRLVRQASAPEMAGQR